VHKEQLIYFREQGIFNKFNGLVAQSGERQPVTLKVVGSKPIKVAISFALIAQLVEQLICNHQVRRSSRRGGTNIRGYSSVGRAVALQASGQEFEPPYLHHYRPPLLNPVGNHIEERVVLAVAAATRLSGKIATSGRKQSRHTAGGRSNCLCSSVGRAVV
jgi:hypothetical protein